MKLRIRDNSLRFRLDQKDVDALCQSGQVQSSTQFAPNLNLTIRVVRRHQAQLLEATIEQQLITLWVRENDALDWMQNSETGLGETQSSGDVALRLLLEKDYCCLQERVGESDEHAFAWPEADIARPLTC